MCQRKSPGRRNERVIKRLWEVNLIRRSQSLPVKRKKEERRRGARQVIRSARRQGSIRTIERMRKRKGWMLS